MAMAAFGMYMGTLIIGVAALMLVEPHDFADLLFESVSAIGTVGLSLGVTGDLSTAGKWIVIAMMFAGRLGPITIGVAVFPKPSEVDEFRRAPADVAV